MQLLKLKNVQLTTQECIFKESALIQFLAGLLGVGIGIGIFLGYRYGKLPFYVFVLSGIVPVLFSAICFRHCAKAMAPTNWLLAIGPDRILIKFRSYLNSHLPVDDPQVVLLSFSEIEAAQIIKEKIRYYSSQRNSKTTEYQSHFDLHIKTESLKLLQERLKYERSVKTYKDSGIYKSSTKARHYPVSVPDDKIIRIQWRGSGSFVTPGVKKAANLLARNHVVIKPVQRKDRDFTTKAIEGGAKADDKILELAERGKILAATRLAKRVYNYDTTEARKFVESLLQ
jgi:hypothetical protein